ncbi:hypothetical protein [Komagataeibacter rhaeticus]|uniref:hypothetical protein n=1 Tax=Komagataeibacter rhaeticus TaxID=215221 RepID=UPI0039E77576
MRRGLSIMLALCGLGAGTPSAQAHRLDEYLQATVIDLTRHEVAVTLRLTPGVDVAPGVIRQIDGNGDGAISPAEQRAYGRAVAGGLSLSLDGRALPLRVRTLAFPSIAAMRAGDGMITLRLAAAVNPAPAPGAHHLVYASHGAGPDAVYLVNALLPRDPGLRVTGQQRSADQSSCQLDFTVDR